MNPNLLQSNMVHTDGSVCSNHARGTRMSIKLGELLVEMGALSPAQRDEILDIQSQSPRPFGVIAEERFELAPSVIEEAWAAQYAMIAARIDPLSVEIDSQAYELISSRQAWQFGLIPIKERDGEIEFVTSMECLARALRFVGWRIPGACSFGICDLHTLKRGLAMHYPIAQMDPRLMDQMVGKTSAA